MTTRQMITMSKDMQARLSAAAREDGVSMSEVVRRALESRFAACAGDENIVRDLRAFRDAEFRRRPPDAHPCAAEAADALAQMGWDRDKAARRLTNLATEHPEAEAAELIALALKVE